MNVTAPLPDAGAYYAPGSGAESVIADVKGIRTEARRALNAEREAERQLVGACRALDETTYVWDSPDPDRPAGKNPALQALTWALTRPCPIIGASSCSMRRT